MRCAIVVIPHNIIYVFHNNYKRAIGFYRSGVKQINNVVYIGTTNYPEKLAERISSRPSRFDRRYQIDLPSSDIRKAYLENKLGKESKDISDIVKKTEGMSLAHLKELVISVKIFGSSFKEAIEQLEGYKNRPIIKKSGKKQEIGFSQNNNEK